MQFIRGFAISAATLVATATPVRGDIPTIFLKGRLKAGGEPIAFKAGEVARYFGVQQVKVSAL